jgi:hypothetical protein
MLLYVFSLEALINRALDAFLPGPIRDFVLEREARFKLEDKWLLLPLLVSPNSEATFDKSKYPWSHFTDLVDLRNDYVHPKHDRPAYYKAVTSHRFEPLPWNQIPHDAAFRETAIIYRQILVPKDPYAIRPQHLDTIKKTVDDMIATLDSLLTNRLTKNNWLHSDNFTLVYPPDASFSDLPPDPSPIGPPLPAASSSDIEP